MKAIIILLILISLYLGIVLKTESEELNMEKIKSYELFEEKNYWQQKYYEREYNYWMMQKNMECQEEIIDNLLREEDINNHPEDILIANTL